MNYHECMSVGQWFAEYWEQYRNDCGCDLSRYHPDELAVNADDEDFDQVRDLMEIVEYPDSSDRRGNVLPFGDYIFMGDSHIHRIIPE